MSDVPYYMIDEDIQDRGCMIFYRGRAVGDTRDEIIDAMVMEGIKKKKAKAIYEHCLREQLEEEGDDSF